jgi:hypothetical protein
VHSSGIILLLGSSCFDIQNISRTLGILYYIILYYICAYQSLPIPYFFIFYSAVLCCIRIRVRYILLYIIYSNKYVFCPLNDFHPILDFCVLFFFFVFSWRIIFNAVFCVFLNLRLKAVNSPYYWHSIEAFIFLYYKEIDRHKYEIWGIYGLKP